MFNFISKKIRSLIFDDKFICNLIKKTVKEHLETNWDIQLVEHFDDRNYVLLMGAAEDVRDKITVITSPYYGYEKFDKGFEGYMQFNISSIKFSIASLGYFDSLKEIKSMVLHDVRYCQQYDFLRKAGGDELIRRVSDSLYGIRTPRDENILEVDATAFSLYDINFDFNDIFARYIKNDCESGDKHERFLPNSWCQSKFI